MKTLSIITSIVFILNGLIHLMGMVTSLELKEAAAGSILNLIILAMFIPNRRCLGSGRHTGGYAATSTYDDKLDGFGIDSPSSLSPSI